MEKNHGKKIAQSNEASIFARAYILVYTLSYVTQLKMLVKFKGFSKILLVLLASQSVNGSYADFS